MNYPAEAKYRKELRQRAETDPDSILEELDSYGIHIPHRQFLIQTIPNFQDKEKALAALVEVYGRIDTIAKCARDDVYNSMANLATPAARRFLENALKTETDPYLLEDLEGYLSEDQAYMWDDSGEENDKDISEE